MVTVCTYIVCSTQQVTCSHSAQNGISCFTVISTSNSCLATLFLQTNPSWALSMYWSMCLFILVSDTWEERSWCAMAGYWLCSEWNCSLLRILHEDCLFLSSQLSSVLPWVMYFCWPLYDVGIGYFVVDICYHDGLVKENHCGHWA